MYVCFFVFVFLFFPVLKHIMYIFIKNFFCIFSCLYLKKKTKKKKNTVSIFTSSILSPQHPPLRTPCHSVPVKLKGLFLMMKEKKQKPNKYVRKKKCTDAINPSHTDTQTYTKRQIANQLMNQEAVTIERKSKTIGN